MLNPMLSVPVAAAIGIANSRKAEGLLAMNHPKDGGPCTDYIGAVLLGFGVPFDLLKEFGSHTAVLQVESLGTPQDRTLIQFKIDEARGIYGDKYSSGVINDNDRRQIKREAINSRMIAALAEVARPHFELTELIAA